MTLFKDTRTVLLSIALSGAQAAAPKAISKIPNGQKMIALTFDDGPNAKYTEPILDVLERQNVKATFFQVGKNMKKEPELSRLVLEKKHEIGNHSMTHPPLPEHNTAEAINGELRDFQALCVSTTGRSQLGYGQDFSG
jgi:peptidoglycan/xylan/chitin deacetylase (PgdA/CDA1 family)